MQSNIISSNGGIIRVKFLPTRRRLFKNSQRLSIVI